MLPPSYSPLPERPVVQWPQQARVAVWVVINIEHFTFGKLGTALQPHLHSSPEIANYGWRDYGNRVGIFRLFDLFRELNIPVTAALNAEICELYPAILDGIQSCGWEVMAHGLNNSTGHSGLSTDAETSLIQTILLTLEKGLGFRPQGWLTPGFSVTEHTFELLRSAGILYTADWVNDDQPHWLELPRGRLLAIPYTLEANDISLCLSARLTGPAFAEAIQDQFDQLWLEGEQQGRVMAIGLHPFIVGQPLRLKYLRQCLTYIQQRPQTWLTTGSQIYDWVVHHYS
ncbi:MAG: polysaccharide deacetylase family protein [Synechococcaceae cyanobacterium SM2_3_1]|nr:polysaccharide deacetylase family protein [Synechococcaceae cyanobacterium SM2_3_1]